MGKERADKLLVERGLVESRAKAQALIMAGKVFSADRRIAKAGDLVAEDAPLEVKGQDHPWVSRGGLKLAHALSHFALDPRGSVAIDVGASTGGFTRIAWLCFSRRSAGAALPFSISPSRIPPAPVFSTTPKSPPPLPTAVPSSTNQRRPAAAGRARPSPIRSRPAAGRESWRWSPARPSTFGGWR